MNTAITRNPKSSLETSLTSRLFRCSAALLLAFGCITSALAGPPSKTQDEDVVLAGALLLARSHYCSVVNHSTRSIEFTVAIWSESALLLNSQTEILPPGYRINIFNGYPGNSISYCTVTYVGQKSEARAAHCGFSEVPGTYDLSSQACLPLD